MLTPYDFLTLHYTTLHYTIHSLTSASDESVCSACNHHLNILIKHELLYTTLYCTALHTSGAAAALREALPKSGIRKLALSTEKTRRIIYLFIVVGEP